jgi:hypothetical protein
MSEDNARAAESGEESELTVTVLCPPRSGGLLIGAPRREIGWTVARPWIVHQ